MTSFIELWHRWKQHLRFNVQEITYLGVASLAIAFIFSFRDWGGTSFSLVIGLSNFFLALIATTLSFFFRTACQKMYALAVGYRATFKVWWTGIFISLISVFISAGRLPLVAIGSVENTFMVKQRLGEFRYGFSYGENAVTAAWGIYGNLIAAILFSIGALALPGNYFFDKAVLINLVMAILTLIPLPQIGGLQIYWGDKKQYFLSAAGALLAPLLLLGHKVNIMNQKIGLILAIIIALIATLIVMAIQSEL